MRVASPIGKEWNEQAAHIADYAVGKTDGNGNLNSGVAQPTIEYIKIIEN